MTRSEVRQKLEMAWWRQLGLTLAPLLVVCLFFGSSEPLIPVLAIPLFIAGIVFVSVKPFGAHKRALAATQAAIDTPEEPLHFSLPGFPPGLLQSPYCSACTRYPSACWRFPAWYCFTCIGCRQPNTEHA